MKDTFPGLTETVCESSSSSKVFFPTEEYMCMFCIYHFSVAFIDEENICTCPHMCTYAHGFLPTVS